MRAAAALLAALLVACAHEPMDESAATAEAGYGRVFGRIELVEEDTWRAKASVWQKLTLFARSTSSGEMHYFTAESDGSFYWPLKAGEYTLLGFQMDRPAIAGRPVRGRLATTFSARRGEALYVGDLRVEVEKTRYHFSISDRYAGALSRIQAKAAESKLATDSALMRLEPRPGQYRQVTDICTASWGLKCSDADTYQGVVPVEPSSTGWEHSAVNTLAPLLEWAPSSRAGMRYDVAIYESLSFAHTPTASVADLRGTLVAYAEGLHEPRWTPAPLLPGKRYQWTVRLRDGDTVSTWSSIGQGLVWTALNTPLHDLFLSGGVGTLNQYFGFETQPR